MRTLWVLVALLAAAPAAAQQSPTFRITESTFNAGGTPGAGGEASSPGFRLRLDAIGDAVATGSAAGPFRVDGGFVAGLRPPAEVAGLRFLDATTLSWEPDGSVGTYALYRGAVTQPFDPNYGACLQPPPDLTATTATDADLPASGAAFFYLVTARNRLGEESTKGAGRSNPTACP